MLLKFLKNNVVLIVAVIAAAASCFIIPPDAEYFKYFDWRTLACLFGTLLVVCALSDIHFFEILARKIVTKFKNMRNITFALVFITYFGSMILANDMALITFLPLGYFALSRTGKKKYMAYIFILQNIAANLGGMLTPFGNPQNLFLYSYFNIPTIEFLRIMAPPFCAALVLIVLCCFFIKPEPAEIIDDVYYKTDKKKIAVYLILFALSILSVFRIFPYYYGIAAVALGIIISDRRAYKSVNYGLLFTFCAFFVFSGNLSRVSAVHEFVASLLTKNTLLVTVLSCQIISNVPTATLLSRFTSNYPALLVGVNIGGIGTLVASLASLITFNEYRKHGDKPLKYLGLFSLVNFSFLIILIAFETLVL